MKVYEEAALTAAELRIEVRLFAERDHRITCYEQELIDLSERVYVFAEATAIRQRAAQRCTNGAFDRNILADLRKADALLASVPAQACGGGHGSGGRIRYHGRASKDRIQLSLETVSKSEGD